MLSVLQQGPRAVGVKQSQRAVSAGKAKLAFVARDAEDHVTRPFIALCQQQSVSVESVPTMAQLGAVCGIHVGCAVAVALLEE